MKNAVIYGKISKNIKYTEQFDKIHHFSILWSLKKICQYLNIIYLNKF